MDRLDRFDVHLRLLPLSGAVFVARSGGYTLLSLESDQDEVLFREDDDSDSLAEAESTGKTWSAGTANASRPVGSALPEANRTVIEARRADALVQLDRLK